MSGKRNWFRKPAKVSECPKCEQIIQPRDVFKTVTISGSPHHVALVYLCPACKERSKAISTHIEWNQLTKESEQLAAYEDKEVRAAMIELDAIETAEELRALWRSYDKPLIREAVKDACGCEECRRRLYRDG